MPESDQVWDASRLALRDPAQLMLADAEYDPTRQAFVHEHRTRWLTLRVTEADQATSVSQPVELLSLLTSSLFYVRVK